MAFVFWVAVALVGYVYVGYPLLLRAWAWSRRRPEWTRPHTPSPDAQLPAISIVVAARNEARRLEARIENLLALDFPADKRQIIVVLDGPTEESLSILERYFYSVDVVTVPEGGKAAALNAGVSLAVHDILVFADARQRFAADALRQLVAPFGDATVGGVTGELLLDAEAIWSDRRSRPDRRAVGRPGPERRQMSSTIAEGVGLYWAYEKALRRLESTVASTLGATGAIYAVRRSLWSALPAETILDDVLVPMRVVLQGFRVVFNGRARAFDRAADADVETRRKIRTLAGNYQLLSLEPRLILPWRNPVWLQFASHKLGRLAVPYALLTMFGSSIALSASPFYSVMLWMQVGFYVLAGYGAVLELASRGARRPGPVRTRQRPLEPLARDAARGPRVREVA